MGRLILTDREKEDREKKWEEAYQANGNNAKQAAITAGWKPISASNAGTDMRRKLHGDEKPDSGYFYVINLIPEAQDLNRVKLGFSNNVDQRLQNHRCTAPTADVIQTWPCKRTWEVAAMDVVSRGEKQVGHDRSEVFDVVSMDEVIHRGNQFFSMMPCPSNGSSS
jgi:hypothetical protein